MTKALSQEFGKRQIRVNAVSPGPVSTDLWLGANGVANTVASLVTMLASPRLGNVG